MLLGKEIKKTMLSITFVVFVIALLGILAGQDVLSFSGREITVPQ